MVLTDTDLEFRSFHDLYVTWSEFGLLMLNLSGFRSFYDLLEAEFYSHLIVLFSIKLSVTPRMNCARRNEIEISI